MWGRMQRLAQWATCLHPNISPGTLCLVGLVVVAFRIVYNPSECKSKGGTTDNRIDVMGCCNKISSFFCCQSSPTAAQPYCFPCCRSSIYCILAKVILFTKISGVSWVLKHYFYLKFNITVESLKWTTENPSNGYYWQMHVLGAHIQLLTGDKQLSAPRRALGKHVPLVSRIRALGHLSHLSQSCLIILR